MPLSVMREEGVGGLLEVGTRYVAYCEGDVPLHARLPYISGTSLEVRNPCPAGLIDGDNGLVLAEQVEELVHEQWAHSLMASAALRTSMWQMWWLSRSTLGGKVA